MPKGKRQFIVFTTLGRFEVKADNFTHAARLIATAIYGKGSIIRVDKKRD
jgi:hypothetical protein